ncbi:MAG: hypothetical protein V8R85_10100 [Frisingicoccus sp.]
MRTIELERVNFFIGSTALLEVYIDGEKCGELKNGGSLKQILDENDHTIQFSMNIRINHQEYRRMFYNEQYVICLLLRSLPYAHYKTSSDIPDD